MMVLLSALVSPRPTGLFRTLVNFKGGTTFVTTYDSYMSQLVCFCWFRGWLHCRAGIGISHLHQLKRLNQYIAVLLRQSHSCRLPANASWFNGGTVHSDAHLKVTAPKTSAIRRRTSETSALFCTVTISHLWGIIHPAKCWSEKYHYVEKADAQSDLQGAWGVRGRKWDRNGRGGQWGWFL